ncbi:MAG: SurA N-terminal domain-containing protein [Thiobacillaceae bacterium]
MLEAIRKHAKGWVAKIILALIAFTFALFGVDSYMKGGGGADAVAVVGDTKISGQEYSRELQQQADRMREALGQNFDRAVTETPEFRKNVLDSMIERKALLIDAQQQGFRAPDSYIDGVLLQIPAFQENGVFSSQRFEALLRQRNMTPAGFANDIRQGYMLEAQTTPVSLGAFIAKTPLTHVAHLLTQQREVSVIDLPIKDVSSQVSVSDSDVQNYYASHKAEFTEPEKIRAEYLALTLAAAMPGVVVNEQEISAFYQANSARLGQPEQRTASHILIAVPKGASATIKGQARAKAEQLTDTVRKAPASFGDLARKESQDPGSAAQNGSLGSFARGAMVKPFDDAVFSMKPGEVRGPVESEFGFHIIRLDSIQAAATVPLDKVRSEIETELRKQKAQKKFSELAENFSNLVYEKAGSLKPAADSMRLAVQTTDWMSPKSAPAPFSNPKLSAALFSADSIKNKQNTEAIEISPGVLVAARVIEYRPAAVHALAEVSAAIQQKLGSERAAKLLREKGEALISALKGGKETGLNWSDFKMLSRQQNAGFDPKSLALVFRADTGKLPTYTGMMNPDDSYRIVRVSRVLEGAQIDPQLLASVESRVQQALQGADLKAMVTLAKTGYKVEIRPGALDLK